MSSANFPDRPSSAEFSTGLPATIPAAEWDALVSAVEGPVLVPGDVDYAEECAIYNVARALRPAIVVGAASTADVAAAVQFAGQHGLAVGVKATGHQVMVPADGALLITTHRLQGIAVDTEQRVVRVAAGVLWHQVIEKLAPLGLAAASGSMPDVSVVGYTLGGGLSPVFGRSKGYAADHVRAVEMVTADGVQRRVTAESDPELFWAIRGGKGHFGVVTALEFDVFPLAGFYGGGLYFPGERLADVVHVWREWVADLPEETSTSICAQRLPPLPELPEPLRGAFVLHLRFAHLGSAEEAERLLAPLRAAAPVLLDGLGAMSYDQVRSIHSDPVGPVPYFDRTMSLDSFPEEAADAFVAVAGPDAKDTPTVLELRLLGGALGRAPEVPNAVPGRGAPFLIFAATVGDPSQGDTLRENLGRTIGAFEPWTDPRLDANFLSPDELPDRAAWAAWLGPDRLARLTEVKRAYDPANVFRANNHNILGG